MVKFTGARKQRSKSVKFGHDASEGKNIDRVVVAAAAEDVFRGTVPAGADVFGEGGRVSDFFDESKVADLDGGLVLHEYVLGLNVSMEEAMLVNVVKAQRNLSDNVSDLFVGKGVVVQFAHLHHSVEVHVQQFKDDHQHCVVEEHLAATDYVDVLQADHGFYFSVTHC